MKKILVPTDFSDTSKNAAEYAAQMAADIPDCTLVLFNVYDTFVAGSDGSPLTESDDDRKVILNQALTNLSNELKSLAPATIECATVGDNSLVDAIERYVRHEGIHMVVMGITGATPLEQIFMGSNTLQVVSRVVCPVLVVPPRAVYRKINNVMFTCDFKDVENTVPRALIQSVLNDYQPDMKLHVVNVDTEHYVELSEEYKAQREKLDKILKDYNREYYFIRMYDFLDAISQFTTDKNIDLILTIPRKHSFLSGLFKSSHTKKLAYHSHVPLLAVHE